MSVPKSQTASTFPNNLPSMASPLAGPDGGIAVNWYRALLALFNRTGGTSGINGAQLSIDDDSAQLFNAMSLPVHGDSAPLPMGITPGPSPFAYQAPFRGFVNVEGGTVSDVSWSRDGGVTYISISGGLTPVFTGDLVQITYSAAPTITMMGS